MNPLKTQKTDGDMQPAALHQKRCWILIVSAALIGILANVLFFDKNPGLSYPIFVIAFYGAFFLNAGKGMRIRPDFGWLLLIPVSLLSLTWLIFSNPLFHALNFIAIPILIVIQTTLISGRASEQWSSFFFIRDVLYGFFYRPFAYIALPFRIIAGFIRSRSGLKKNSTFLKVILGVIATVPLLVIIVSLLASADIEFERLVNRLPGFFFHLNFNDWLPQFLFAAGVAILTFSYLWSLIIPSGADRSPKKRQTVTDSGLDPVISVTMLSMINMIYLLFTWIQFSYLFSGFSFSLPDHFTYAEYARRGFFELILVTLINFTILIILIYFTRKSSTGMNLVLKSFQSLLVLCTGIMLLSAFIRMYLYEMMYGFTYLRILTHAFMIFLFVLLILTLVRIWRKNINLWKGLILSSVTAFVLINYLNIDALIANYNIDRYQMTGKIDTVYLGTLSDDAVPELVRLLGAKDERVSARMENELLERKKRLDADLPWQSFNLSKERARKILSGYHFTFHPGYESHVEYQEP
ncbi:DUF4153 domain-containing protein [Sporolactobacillus sp. THM19-2]|uniref:DUF4153 domain-containing protein n=1 Tax=Sporolactobacillus sp. THM19-2 TaxID=2511171 RepID=UPI001F0E2CDF|nr:DUF4173 domain-containing protein [Sporolactobacillus sp. THM19-2]